MPTNNKVALITGAGGRRALARPSPDAASKAGVIAFTQSLAQEVFKRWGLQLESMVRGQEYDAVVQAAIV